MQRCSPFGSRNTKYKNASRESRDANGQKVIICLIWYTFQKLVLEYFSINIDNIASEKKPAEFLERSGGGQAGQSLLQPGIIPALLGAGFLMKHIPQILVVDLMIPIDAP